MREKLKKDKEEAEKKRLAEENAAAEAKSRDPYSELYAGFAGICFVPGTCKDPWSRENFSQLDRETKNSFSKKEK